MSYLLGFDIGSSSVKATLVNAENIDENYHGQSPKTEMRITAKQSSWAEQDPNLWWEHVVKSCLEVLAASKISSSDIASIGIAYQMHGLVCINEMGAILRDAIIWCDSRAVDIGEKCFKSLGSDYCLNHLLNSPGNFTASKLAWLAENEAATYERIHKIMLPGDYIAWKMTGKIQTTISGLSEGVFWDFKRNDISEVLLEDLNIDRELLPDIVENFTTQGRLTEEAANQLGLTVGIPITYRAGDQPNNALSLNVLKPGQVAATGGTSGVVYALTDKARADEKSRINAYRWIKEQFGAESYSAMEQQAERIPVGSEGLRILPFGNGAERLLENLETGAQINNLQLNIHKAGHFYRAGLESIAFAFAYGLEMMMPLMGETDTIRAGNDNLFQSDVFSTTLATILDVEIEIIETTGSLGAAVASGINEGSVRNLEGKLSNLNKLKSYVPAVDQKPYLEAYELWRTDLKQFLIQSNDKHITGR